MAPKTKFDFGPLRPIKKSDIRRPTKGGKISQLAVFKKLQEVIDYIAKNGVSPFEEALEIDLTAADTKEEMKALKIKNPGVSFLARLRKELKNHQIKNVEVVQREKGHKLYLVGNE
jgi:hypothetical protein